MTDAASTHIEPAPTPEEAAAIVAVLEVLSTEGPDEQLPVRSRWELAGLLGHPPPRGTKLEGSLWSSFGREGTG